MSHNQIEEALGLIREALYGVLLDDKGNRSENGLNHYPDVIMIQRKIMMAKNVLLDYQCLKEREAE